MIIRHYYMDSEQFSNNDFIKSVNTQGQTISYFGFNYHFQNRIDENRFRDLKEQVRKTILHTKSRWRSAIELILLPYALQNEKNREQLT